MDVDQPTYQDIARALDVSVATIKSWRRKFPASLPPLNQGKPLRFAPGALDACREIRDGYLAGLSTDELHARLEPSPAQAGPSTEVQSQTMDEGLLADLARDMAQLVRSQRETAGVQPQAADRGLLADLARDMAQLVRSQRETAQRLERLEKSLGKQLGQMHGHPKLLEELRDLKRRTTEARPEPVTDAPRAGDHAAPAHAAPSKGTPNKGAPNNGTPDKAGNPGPPQKPQRPKPEAPAQPQRVVRIRTRAGEYERYALQLLGPEPEQGARPVPDDAFLELPVVAQNAQGDFLGVPGLTAGSLAARLQPGCSWTRQGGLWLLTLATLPAQTLTLTPTVTPRGNQVAVLTRLATPNTELDAEARVAFLRGLRLG